MRLIPFVLLLVALSTGPLALPAVAQDYQLGADPAVALRTGCKPFALAVATVGDLHHGAEHDVIGEAVFRALEAAGLLPTGYAASAVLVVEVTVAPYFVLVVAEFRREAYLPGPDAGELDGIPASTWRQYRAVDLSAASPAEALAGALGGVLDDFTVGFRSANGASCGSAW